jgi:hypothetical protein
MQILFERRGEWERYGNKRESDLVRISAVRIKRVDERDI